LGWAIGEYEGHRLIRHGGQLPGFTSNIARFVDDEVTVVVLTNTSDGDPAAIATEIAKLLW
jgi:D-alanyl-D-alanine carboxypeptidase